jgi:hypothetical protein
LVNVIALDLGKMIQISGGQSIEKFGMIFFQEQIYLNRIGSEKNSIIGLV